MRQSTISVSLFAVIPFHYFFINTLTSSVLGFELVVTKMLIGHVYIMTRLSTRRPDYVALPPLPKVAIARYRRTIRRCCKNDEEDVV